MVGRLTEEKQRRFDQGDTHHMTSISATRPTPASTPATAASPGVTVKAGDTLTSLAASHGTSVDALRQSNPQLVNPDLLYPGQVLALPSASAPVAAPATTTSPPSGSAATSGSSPTAESSQAARTRVAAAGQLVVGRLAPLPSTRLEAHIVAGRVLQEGARGAEVVDLQRFLGMKSVDQDGVFGPATRATLTAYQARNGLEADGVVGPATMTALKASGVGSEGQRSMEMHLATGAPVREGARGDHVLALQRALGFSLAGQTGVFGPTTRAAVEEVQRRAFNMTPSSPGFGTVGPQTWSAIKAPPATSAASPAPVAGGPVSISERGRAQMSALVQHARGHHAGASRGRCMEYVWRYMTTSGYGKLDAWGDLPRMNGGLARGLPDYLNASPAHLKEAGLQRLDTTSPRITNPHDSRIPPGAIIVVAPGSYGTAHPTAGDIVVKGTRPGEFINDGPRMNYGTQSSWYGRILGVYVPE